MTELELDKNYYIMTKFNFENRKVIVCRDRKSLKHLFFIKTNLDFEPVKDKVLERVLKDIFKDSLGDFSSIKISEDLGQQTTLKIYEFCHSKILELSSNLPQYLQDRVNFRLENLNFVSKKEYLNEINDPVLKVQFDNSLGGYSMMGNIIVCDPNMLSDKIIMHEMLHCASSNSASLSTGFLKVNFMKNIEVGRSINEYYTQYFTDQLCGDSTMQEDIQLELINILTRGIDAELIKDFYFDNQLLPLLKCIADKYNTNLTQIFKLSLKLDSLYNAFMLRETQITDEESIVRICIQETIIQSLGKEIYKEIIELEIKKHILENKKIEDYCFIAPALYNKNNSEEFQQQITECVNMIKKRYTSASPNENVSNVEKDSSQIRKN